MANRIHVMKDKSTGDWYAKQDNAGRKSFTGAPTQQAAIDRTIGIARNQGLEMAVHRGDNNQIRESNTYFKPDPCPPKG